MSWKQLALNILYTIMGISCELNLNRPPNGVFRPGDVVRGAVKYAVDEDMLCSEVVLSLKGKGKVHWTEGSAESRVPYSGEEEYVTIHNNLHETSDENTLVRIGSYQVSFEFLLPKNIPSSFKDSICKIKYYIRIKFVRPGLKFSKKFRSSFTVVNHVVSPTDNNGSLICAVHKNPKQFFGKSDGDIKFKGTLKNSIVNAGEEALIEYGITNTSAIKIKKVSINLIEKLTYISQRGYKKKNRKKIDGCKTTIEDIHKRNIEMFNITIPTLEKLHSIQHSKIFKREYFIVAVVKLPLPHRNIELKIPLLIEDSITSSKDKLKICFNEEGESSFERAEDAPPSYWEVMEEDQKEFASKS